MSDFSDTVLQLFSDVLPPALTAVVGWYFGKRKNKAEAVKSEVENVGSALKLYREMIDDLRTKQQRLQSDFEKLEGEYSALKKKLEDSELENMKLRKRILALEKTHKEG